MVLSVFPILFLTDNLVGRHGNHLLGQSALHPHLQSGEPGRGFTFPSSVSPDFLSGNEVAVPLPVRVLFALLLVFRFDVLVQLFWPHPESLYSLSLCSRQQLYCLKK